MSVSRSYLSIYFMSFSIIAITSYLFPNYFLKSQFYFINFYSSDFLIEFYYQESILFALLPLQKPSSPPTFLVCMVPITRWCCISIARICEEQLNFNCSNQHSFRSIILMSSLFSAFRYYNYSQSRRLPKFNFPISYYLLAISYLYLIISYYNFFTSPIQNFNWSFVSRRDICKTYIHLVSYYLFLRKAFTSSLSCFYLIIIYAYLYSFILHNNFNFSCCSLKIFSSSNELLNDYSIFLLFPYEFVQKSVFIILLNFDAFDMELIFPLDSSHYEGTWVLTNPSSISFVTYSFIFFSSFLRKETVSAQPFARFTLEIGSASPFN